MHHLICTLLQSLSLGLLFGCASQQPAQNMMERPEVRSFIHEVSTRHAALSSTKLSEWFSEVRFQERILDRIARPYESKPWYDYWPRFVTNERAKEGAIFWKLNHTALARAETTYGIPPEILVAILGVETRYGKQTGGYRALDALATLTFGYPKRAPYFRKELEQFLLLLHEEQWNPKNVLASYAGAIGQPQFMPSSYRNFAVDFDGDGKRDLLNSPADAIGSIAAYFKAHGWKKDGPVVEPITSKIPKEQNVGLLALEELDGKRHWVAFHNFYVITRYNHSIHYAMAVYQLSRKIAFEMARSHTKQEQRSKINNHSQ